MGKIWSKKAKSTREQLETLDEKIKSIEAYTVSTQEKQKRLIGQFLVISIGLYVISFIVFYFLFFPPTWEKRVVYSTPLLIFPFVIFSIKRLVAWYFQRKVNKNSSQLKDLRKEKKDLLEQVMDKETYKVALELLSRFSEKPALLRTNPQQTSGDSPRSSLKESPRPSPQVGLQQRMVPRPVLTPSSQRPVTTTPYGMRTPYPVTPYQVANRMPNSPYPPQYRTPFPVIDQRNKGVVEKLVDYLVGDGPSNRFAMICRQCMSHNGMALQEEYEFTAFKCAFCGFLNPARKQRPIAPRLEYTPERTFPSQRQPSTESTSEEEKVSGSDSESDGLEKKTPEPKTDTETLENTEKEEIQLEPGLQASAENLENPEEIQQEMEETKPEVEKKDD